MGSMVASPRSPRCRSIPETLLNLTISIAHLGSFLIRLTELASVVPSSQIASSSQMNHIGALQGAPSSETVAKFAISGRANIFFGSNSLGITKPMHARFDWQGICSAAAKSMGNLGSKPTVPTKLSLNRLPSALRFVKCSETSFDMQMATTRHFAQKPAEMMRSLHTQPAHRLLQSASRRFQEFAWLPQL